MYIQDKKMCMYIIPNIRSKHSDVNKFNSDIDSNLDIDSSFIYNLSRVL